MEGEGYSVCILVLGDMCPALSISVELKWLDS